MITKEEVLKNINEEELFCLIGGFLDRLKEKGLTNEDNFIKINNKNYWYLTDKEVFSIIKSYLEDYKKC